MNKLKLSIMFDRDETELIGQDGHIYRGRFEGLDRMPDLPPVRGFHLKFCFYLHLVSLLLSHYFRPPLSAIFNSGHWLIFLCHCSIHLLINQRKLFRNRKT